MLRVRPLTVRLREESRARGEESDQSLEKKLFGHPGYFVREGLVHVELDHEGARLDFAVGAELQAVLVAFADFFLQVVLENAQDAFDRDVAREEPVQRKGILLFCAANGKHV